ncbi:MAG TPA: hypothetical protein P5291_01945, partial [Flavobacteriales bacterium]|nr:hypothetical protein [Flavobacteriales bacterium]
MDNLLNWLKQPVAWWLHLRSQMPELEIERIGLVYIYPIFLVLIVIEYLKAKELFDLKESFSGFVIGMGATVVR